MLSALAHEMARSKFDSMINGTELAYDPGCSSSIADTTLKPENESMNKIMQTCLVAAALILAARTCAADEDTRIKVDLPAMMKTHMLHSMRDHLLAVHEIQAALAKGKLDQAGEIAETRLGMSSLDTHGAAHMAPFMPEGMQAIGTEMHHAASRFAMTASEGDLSRSLAALSRVTEQCVACHMTYRVN